MPRFKELLLWVKEACVDLLGNQCVLYTIVTMGKHSALQINFGISLFVIEGLLLSLFLSSFISL